MPSRCRTCDEPAGTLHEARISSAAMADTHEVALCEDCWSAFSGSAWLEVERAGTTTAESPTQVSLPSMCTGIDTAMLLIDPDEEVPVDANTAMAELAGYDRSSIRGMALEELFPTPKGRMREEQPDLREIAGGGETSVSVRLEQADGGLKWVTVHLVPVDRGDRAYVLGEVEDITAYRERSRRLWLLARVVRHNLRNDANVILGHAEQLQRAIEEERLQESASKIQHLAMEIGGLHDAIDDLEHIAAADSTEREPIRLRAATNSAAATVRENYPEATIEIEARSDPWCVAGSGLEFALRHGIENAVEHATSDGAEARVVLEDTEADRYASVTILDRNAPISEDELGALDEAFGMTTTAHGSGIGLWIMQSCVESLGGLLDVSERENGGNAVELVLPTTEPPE